MQFNSICLKKETSEYGRKRRNGGDISIHTTTFKMMLFLVFSALILIQTTEAGNGTVQRRGFKSSLLSTARGFGKRASLYDRGIIPTTAIGFGKRSLPLVHRNSEMYPKELSSIRDLRNELEMSPLLRQLNEEASKNPHIIPLLLDIIRENNEAGRMFSDYDNSQ